MPECHSCAEQGSSTTLGESSGRLDQSQTQLRQRPQAPPSGGAATEVIVIDAVEPLADREEESPSAKRARNSAASSTEPMQRSQSMQSSRPPTADVGTQTEPVPELEGVEVSGSQLHADTEPYDADLPDTLT